jgi:predicted ATPase/signal transduction histidine kinase
MLHLSGYAIEERLSATATGELFWATREQDGRRVLLKVYEALPGSAWDQGQREQSLLEKVRSDHVLPCIGMTQHGDRVVLAMRAVRGVSLRQYLRQRRPRGLSAGLGADLATFLRIAIQLVRILADVHSADLVLRDLAPERILIDPDGLRLWLLDLDGAVDRQRVATAADSRGLREGLAYMAPERSGRMGRATDARSDLYALGAMLYELLVGAPPFVDEDIVALVHAHMTLTPVPPATLAPAIPPVISRLVMTLLAKMPEERYQSAHDLHRDLLALSRRLERTGSLVSVSLQGLSERAEIRIPDRLYGRATECAHLTMALQAARAGRPQLVLLSGPPGIGKSALVHGLSGTLGHPGQRDRPGHVDPARDRGYLIQGKCDPLHGGRPYQAFRAAFDALVDQLMAESEARLAACRDALRARLGAMAGALADVVPRLGLLLGEPPPVAAMGPAETRNRLVLACRRFVDAIASAEHPLVLFLDDLQWADSGSLHLLEALHEDRQAHLLIIGTLRSDAADGWLLPGDMLARLRSAPGRLAELHLAPLGSTELQHLLADALGCAPQRAAPLAALMQRKTDGNPFLVRQFLDYARRRDLFAFDEHGGWTWDIAALEQAGIPDDAVGLMTARLELLEPAMRRVLATAACIGSELDGATLAAALTMTASDADADRAALDRALAALQAQGLLAATRAGWIFTHDKVQEAAYRDLSEAERQERHLRIGRFWLAQMHAEAADPAQSSRLFAVVEQLAEVVPPAGGVALIADAPERVEIATLSWHACLRAMRSAAHGAARKYARAGCALLAGEPWDAHDWLRLRLHLELAESQLLMGDVATAMSEIGALSALALGGPEELVRATRVVRMYQIAGRPEEALRLGLAALRRQGISLPLAPGPVRVMQQVVVTRLAFRRSRVDALSLLPPAEDPLHLLRMELVSELVAAAYALSQNLFFCLILIGIRWTLQHGLSPHAPGLLAALAVVRVGMGQFASARQLLDALQRIEGRERTPATVISPQYICVFIAGAWLHDVRTLDAAMRGFHLRALEHGAIDIAGHVEGMRLQLQLHRGGTLSQLVPELHALQRFCSQNGLLHIVNGYAYLEKLFAQLASDRGNPAGLAAHERADGDLPAMATIGGVHACLVLAVMGAWERVYELAEDLESSAEQLGFSYLCTFHLIHALAALMRASDRTPAPVGPAAAGQPSRRRCMEIVRKSRRLLQRWARHTDVHAPHHVALLDAEVARFHGRSSEAMQLYARAREHAASEGALPLQALADERRAALALDLGLQGDASTYLAGARDAYRAWGAGAKVRELERTHPELRERPLQAAARDAEAASHVTGRPRELSARPPLDIGRVIDLETVLRASQAISDEVALDRVLERVMRGALESSGASKGVLTLVEDGQAYVEAEFDVETGFKRHASVPVTRCAELVPLSVLRYVERTGEPVIVRDATREARFSWDPYVVATGCRSMLCMQLGMHGQKRGPGALYLENRLISGVFTEGRMELLRLLAGQAAIAIDNAKLYQELDGLTRDLETLVDERTAELASANARLEREIVERTRAQEELIALQRQLVDTARAAGMAEIATGVLHNVGNLLNSVNVSVEVLRERMHASRLPALSQAIELVQTNVGALDRFLSEDERGRQILPFLHRLAGRLDEERESAIREIDGLQQHLGSIDVIVRKQQQYAKAPSVVDSVRADELVGDALALASASLQRSAITVRVVHTEGEEPPPVLVDRHKALQILANLLSNAAQALLDAGTPDKRITISTTVEEPGRVRIRVADNGAGIAPEHMPRLFTHGFTTRPGGHGFGLHNSYLAARSMHGVLRAHSDGPGRGAAFDLELPSSTNPTPPETPGARAGARLADEEPPC